MSALDTILARVLADEYVTLPAGCIGGDWQRERVAHVRAEFLAAVAADEGLVEVVAEALWATDLTPDTNQDAPMRPSRDLAEAAVRAMVGGEGR